MGFYQSIWVRSMAFAVICLIIVYYNMAGLSTTNILRLTKDNELPVLSSKCVCSACGGRISALMQLPIVSYIITSGKCKHCNAPIPLLGLLLEVIIWCGLTTIAILFRFCMLVALLGFVYYEMVRALFIIIVGRRANAFAKQYAVAILSMLPHHMVVLFICCLLRM